MTFLDAVMHYGPIAFALLVAITIGWLLIEAHRAPLDPWDAPSRPHTDPHDMDWQWPR